MQRSILLSETAEGEFSGSASVEYCCEASNHFFRVFDFPLLQPGVFRLGLLQERGGRISVSPEREEVFVGVERPNAGGIGVCSG